MPVILTELGEKLRMDADAPTEEALGVVIPYPAELMEAFAGSAPAHRRGADDAPPRGRRVERRPARG
jgi:hypothetical protein